LIEGSKGAVLHTGDFRAEPWFVTAVTRNPYLQPYLACPTSSTSTPGSSGANQVFQTLDAIYLDTACLLQQSPLPTKEHATSGLVDLIRVYPTDVCFFINAWTWGYEDALKVIARTFRCKVTSQLTLFSLVIDKIQIHVDRYKHSIYTHIADPFLRSIVTRDPLSTRFHACERFDRCEHVDTGHGDRNIDAACKLKHGVISKTGKRVVYVNPVGMSVDGWVNYVEETRRRIGDGETLNNLVGTFHPLHVLGKSDAWNCPSLSL
jgi:hypothetical protein